MESKKSKALSKGGFKKSLYKDNSKSEGYSNSNVFESLSNQLYPSKSEDYPRAPYTELNKSGYTSPFETELQSNLSEIEKDLIKRKIDDPHKKQILNVATAMLWEGYGPLKYLGMGGNNYVFKYGESKVLKYCYKDRARENEGNNNMRKVTAFFSEHEQKNLNQKKWYEKYLSKPKYTKDENFVIEEYAPADLHEVTEHKRNMLFSEVLTVHKSLDPLLKKAIRIAKGVAALHAAGRVHQDLKPGNILHVPNPAYSEAQKNSDNGVTYEDKYGKYKVVSETTEKKKEEPYDCYDNTIVNEVQSVIEKDNPKCMSELLEELEEEAKNDTESVMPSRELNSQESRSSENKKNISIHVPVDKLANMLEKDSGEKLPGKKEKLQSDEDNDLAYKAAPVPQELTDMDESTKTKTTNNKSLGDGEKRYFKIYISGERKGQKRKISKNTIRLCDYGFMRKAADEIGKTQTGGTKLFASQAHWNARDTQLSAVLHRDIYGLGMTLGVLLRGKREKSFKKPDNLNSEIPFARYVGINKTGQVDITKERFNKWYESYKPSDANSLCDIYGKAERERVFHFVNLLNNMTTYNLYMKNYRDITKIIEELKKIKNFKTGNKP